MCSLTVQNGSFIVQHFLTLTNKLLHLWNIYFNVYVTKCVLRKVKRSKICDCSEVSNNWIWHPTRPGVLRCARHQHPHEFWLSPLESTELIREILRVINVPLSCSGNLVPHLQTCRSSWTLTGGFHLLTLKRFACIFCNKLLFCNPTPSFAAHHKPSHEPAVRRSRWVQGGQQW